MQKVGVLYHKRTPDKGLIDAIISANNGVVPSVSLVGQESGIEGKYFYSAYPPQSRIEEFVETINKMPGFYAVAEEM